MTHVYEFLIFIAVTTRNGIDKVSKVWDITSAPQKQVLEKQKAHLQLKKHNYFNFAESKSEAEECLLIPILSSGDEREQERQSPMDINHRHTHAANAASSPRRGVAHSKKQPTQHTSEERSVRPLQASKQGSNEQQTSE